MCGPAYADRNRGLWPNDGWDSRKLARSAGTIAGCYSFSTAEISDSPNYSFANTPERKRLDRPAAKIAQAHFE
jgi:hypothetical protein